MDNVNQPPGHDPQGHEPTHPFRFTPGARAGATGPAQPPPGYAQVPPGYGQVPPGHAQVPPGYGQVPPGHSQVPPGYHQARKRRHRAMRWGAGIAAAALLGAGGALAGLQLTGHAPVPANSAQATALNSALSPAGTASCHSAAGTSPGSQASGQASQSRLRCRPHHLRLLRLIHGMYGEVAFYTSHGTQTLAFERGTIAMVSASSVVVRARNGTTWTWNLVSNSVVRKRGKVTTSSALSRGERVFVGGQVSGSTRDIKLILVRGKPGATGASSSSTQPAG